MSIPNYHLYRRPATPAEGFIHVLELGQFTLAQGNHHHLHRHPALFQLTYVTGGSGLHHIGEAHVSLRPGTLYLLRPGVVHACESQDLTGFVLHFSADTLPETLRLRLDQQYYVTARPEEGQELVNGLFRQLSQPLTPPVSRKLLETLIVLTLAYEQLRAGPRVQSSAHHLVRKFMALAEVYYPVNRKLGWYAGQLHCSTNHLGTCVRAHLGRSPGKYLNELVLADARQRLSLETSSVSTIAAELGFRDIDYFWRFFRKHTGQTPLAYRNGRKDPRNVRKPPA